MLRVLSINGGIDHVIKSDRQGEFLPKCFKSAEIAQAFLDACERVGVPLDELKSAPEICLFYDLWWDAYKREAEEPRPQDRFFDMEDGFNPFEDASVADLGGEG